MDKIIKELGIDENYTKPPRKQKKFNHVRDNIPLLEDYNHMADILVLPNTAGVNGNGFRYLLVCTDIATNEFDIEPLKNKDSKTTLEALKKMFKRKYIGKPYASIRTDGGGEFKGVFQKWLYDNDIFHGVSLPHRHTQLSNVESLNKQLGRLFVGYLNSIEEKTQRPYYKWTDIVDQVRDLLNNYRYTTPVENVEKLKDYKYPFYESGVESKYKVGDIVHRQLDYPENALGNQQETSSFRVGDYRFSKVPQKVTKVLYYTGAVPHRYLLDGIKNASFTESQLMKSKETEQKFKVYKIIGRKKDKGKVYYLIWWKGHLKKDATYEPRSELIKDVPLLVQRYEEDEEI